MGFYQFKREQKLNTSVNELWDFISSPKNLKIITPEYMGFDITSEELPEKMHQGMIITYNVTPLFNISTNWVTEITHIKEKEFFVDEQRVGPYKIWHHQHFIKEISDGVLMNDIVSYVPPLGVLGRIVNHFIIEKKLEEIFSFRKTALEKRYGVYK